MNFFSIKFHYFRNSIIIKQSLLLNTYEYTIGHYNPSVGITTYLLTPLQLCMLILYISGGDLKILLRRLSLGRFLAKTLRVNKIAMKSFLKNLSFGVDFKL